MAVTQYAYAAHPLRTEKLARDTGGRVKNLAPPADLETRRVAWNAGRLSLCISCVCVQHSEY